MGLVTHPRVEVAEFDALMADAGWSAPMELLEGEVVAVPPIGEQQSVVTLRLSFALQSWQRASASPGYLLSDVLILVGDERPAPDLLWWTEARRPPPGTGGVQVVPDLVVEVLGPRSRDNDLLVKPGVYERLGVQEFWRVDPVGRTVIVGRRAGDALTDVPPLTGDAVLTSPMLPGFNLPLLGLFAG